MKTLMQVVFLAVVTAVAGLLFAGCASPQIDWNSRVGSYTYDQAVAELGPPDKMANLSDGKTVADWIRRSSGSGVSFGFGTGYSSGSSATGVGVSHTIATDNDKVLRLTFDTDHKLIAWSKNY